MTPQTEIPPAEPTPPAAPPASGLDLARVRRILGGDIRPADYLPVTPEVEAGVRLDMDYLADHIRQRFEAGRIPAAFDPAPEVPIRQRNQRLLSAHHGGQNVAYIENDSGVIVLAVGLKQARALLDAFPYEMRKDVGFGTPETDDAEFF